MTSLFGSPTRRTLLYYFAHCLYGEILKTVGHLDLKFRQFDKNKYSHVGGMLKTIALLGIRCHVGSILQTLTMGFNHVNFESRASILSEFCICKVVITGFIKIE